MSLLDFLQDQTLANDWWFPSVQLFARKQPLTCLVPSFLSLSPSTEAKEEKCTRVIKLNIICILSQRTLGTMWRLNIVQLCQQMKYHVSHSLIRDENCRSLMMCEWNAYFCDNCVIQWRAKEVYCWLFKIDFCEWSKFDWILCLFVSDMWISTRVESLKVYITKQFPSLKEKRLKSLDF